MLTKLIISLTTIALSSFSFAHGMDQPGPHGGQIQMPGPYHIEVIYDAKGTVIIVYLLDMEFRNSVTKNSSVKARISGLKKSRELFCKARETYFECSTSSPQKVNEALVIESVRDGAKGNEARFEFK